MYMAFMEKLVDLLCSESLMLFNTCNKSEFTQNASRAIVTEGSKLEMRKICYTIKSGHTANSDRS